MSALLLQYSFKKRLYVIFLISDSCLKAVLCVPSGTNKVCLPYSQEIPYYEAEISKRRSQYAVELALSSECASVNIKHEP